MTPSEFARTLVGMTEENAREECTQVGLACLVEVREHYFVAKMEDVYRHNSNRIILWIENDIVTKAFAG